MSLHERRSPAQAKRQVRDRIAGQIAELLYQADKANTHATLTDLKPALRATYLAHANEAVFGPPQLARMTLIHVEQAHGDALQADDAETVRQQARRDLDVYADVRKPQARIVDRRRADGAVDGDGRN